MAVTLSNLKYFENSFHVRLSEKLNVNVIN